MEVYTETNKNTCKFIIVTYNSKGDRIERFFFLEEIKDGDVELILKDDGTPKRFNDVFWVNTKFNENNEQKIKRDVLSTYNSIGSD